VQKGNRKIMFNKMSNALNILIASVAVIGLVACGASTNTTTASKAIQTAPTSTPVATSPQAVVASTTKMNLNTATAEQIKSAPNTGNRMVREFTEYRPYSSIVQFRKEIGKYVDAAQVAEYEKYFYVPVSPNNADAATLQQLPGVDAAIADKLIAARPYADKAAFLKTLGELTSAPNATAADGYVEAQ
jgi:DNA uptake protein ComE-like DNA-binding protein